MTSGRLPDHPQLELHERKKALRRFIAMGTAAWTLFALTDFLAAHVYRAPIEYLVAIRLTGTGIGLCIYLFTGRETVKPRLLDWIESIANPSAALLVSLAALKCGGATSPLALGVATVVLSRAVLPAPLRRALPSSLASAATFPLAILIFARADLGDTTVLWAFAQTSLFLIFGAGVAAAGSHMLWSAKEQIHEARKLGSYRLVARIGSGGMGEVWVARQLPLNRPVALKILKETTLRDPAALRRFKREADALSTLSHQNTIRVYDFGASDDGVFFIAMELLDGLDVEAVVDRSGPISPARCVHLAKQVCGSLAEAHSRHIIHCDLKPANIFVTRVGEDYDFAKVLDFGLVRMLANEGHTTVDSIRGTPAFMAPEVIRGETVSAETDIYSMGAVLYWMLTGTPVFQGTGFHDSVMAHLEKPAEPPSKRLGFALPADLEAVVMKCLAKKRVHRYASARELEQALASCACAKEWTATLARTTWEDMRTSLGTLPASKVV